MRSPLLLAAAVTALMVACATGTDVDTTDGIDTDAFDSGSSSNNNNNNDPDNYADSGNNAYQSSYKDSGALSTSDSGTSSASKDSGTTTSLDSGTTTTSKDAGTTTTTGGDNCTGTKSAQRGNESYDNACVDYYEDIDEGDPVGLPCTPGGNDCSSDSSSALLGYSPWCCFVPKSGSNCDFAYSSTPQCVPQ